MEAANFGAFMAPKISPTFEGQMGSGRTSGTFTSLQRGRPGTCSSVTPQRYPERELDGTSDQSAQIFFS